MKEKGWKILAIVFIILFVMETVAVILSIVEGTKIINRESECAYNICEDSVYYEYFPYEEVCECYDIDFNIVKQEYMG